MSRHSMYPPVTPVRYSRPMSSVARFLLALMAGVLLIAALVLGTAWMMNKLDTWADAPAAAFTQGFRAGAQTCGSRL